MATMTQAERIVVSSPFRMKSREEILSELAFSRAEYARGHYKEAGAAIKEMRMRHEKI